ncbi:hypothetical protein EDD22DRAFT_993893 [Suillus occidentalis]|nr:hypothetical protein EDD22DRAFT_993893 [Suillus occidentalis]
MDLMQFIPLGQHPRSQFDNMHLRACLPHQCPCLGIWAGQGGERLNLPAICSVIAQYAHGTAEEEVVVWIGSIISDGATAAYEGCRIFRHSATAKRSMIASSYPVSHFSIDMDIRRYTFLPSAAASSCTRDIVVSISLKLRMVLVMSGLISSWWYPHSAPAALDQGGSSSIPMGSAHGTATPTPNTINSSITQSLASNGTLSVPPALNPPSSSQPSLSDLPSNFIQTSCIL